MDEDVHSGLGFTLRKRGFDAIHAQELERKGKSDSEQLEFAVENNWCIFRYNVKDFVLLHNKYVDLKKEHWGIIVSKQLSLGETFKRILILFQKHSRESMRNKLEFL